MFHVISGIHRISDTYRYFPGVTETSGLIAVGGGIGSLGFGGMLKVHEYCTGQKTTIPYLSDDAAQFSVEIGKTALVYGFKKLAPTAIMFLGMSVLFNTYDQYEKCEFPSILAVPHFQQSKACTCEFFRYTCLS